MNKTTLEQMIVTALEDTKATDIDVLDVRALTDVTDTLVICSANSNRHANTLADKVITHIKQHGIRPLHVTGKDTADWILIDYVDIVVHIMLPETREFYALDKLWQSADRQEDQ